jgi:hypothetical protein
MESTPTAIRMLLFGKRLHRPCGVNQQPQSRDFTSEIPGPQDIAVHAQADDRPWLSVQDRFGRADAELLYLSRNVHRCCQSAGLAARATPAPRLHRNHLQRKINHKARVAAASQRRSGGSPC